MGGVFHHFLSGTHLLRDHRLEVGHDAPHEETSADEVEVQERGVGETDREGEARAQRDHLEDRGRQNARNSK